MQSLGRALLSVLSALADAPRQPASTIHPEHNGVLTKDEREQAVKALIEDYQAHWRELLNLETDNNRWLSLYVTALVLVIGWSLGQATFKSVPELIDGRSGLNGILVLTIPLLNAYYILALAFRGYQIQLLALYLYAVVGPEVSALTQRRFNTWDEWRRRVFQDEDGAGHPEPTRFLYYGLISVLPAGVSVMFMGIWAYYQWSDWHLRGKSNLYFAVVVLVNLTAVVGSLRTTRPNKLWPIAMQRRRQLEARFTSVSVQLSYKDGR